MKKVFFVLIVALLVLIQFQTSKAADVKEWTFLIFMNGHDSMLSPYTDNNLESIQKVGSTNDINVVVQVASMDREETERVYVKKGSHEVIEKLPRVDMGDYQELIKFVEWTVEHYPAKKYFINVWNHGTGWHSIRAQRLRNAFDGFGEMQTQDVSFDSFTGNFISTEQMGTVLKRFASLIGHKVELYGNDACLMAMTEIAAEFTDTVSYFASSQENEPLAGWPYDKLLARWSKNPSMGGDEVGIILTEEYLKLYPDEGANPIGSTFSTIDVSKLGLLMESLSDLANEIKGLGSDKKETLANLASSTHNFQGSPDYKDLYDFVSKLEKSSTLGMNKSVISDFKKAFKEVVLKSVNSPDEEGAHGLSVWLPTYEPDYVNYINRYRKLEFNKKTNWADLLELFIRDSSTEGSR